MDIQSTDDIKVLVDTFYGNVQKDDLLAPIFEDVIGDRWDDHLQVMYTFWSMLLIERRAFTGQPYPKHAVLPLTKAHFDRWLSHFNKAVDSQFCGAVADEAKRLANQIAFAFMHKMGVAE